MHKDFQHRAIHTEKHNNSSLPASTSPATCANAMPLRGGAAQAFVGERPRAFG